MVTGQNTPSAICAAVLTTCERAHQIYSDKLRLSIINLKHIDLATEADKAYHIDEWAALFQAGTWEELLAGQNEIIASQKKQIAVLERALARQTN